MTWLNMPEMGRETPPHDTRVRSASLAPKLSFLVTSSALVFRPVVHAKVCQVFVVSRLLLRRQTIIETTARYRCCLGEERTPSSYRFSSSMPFSAHSTPKFEWKRQSFLPPPRYDLVSTSKRSRAIWTLSDLRAAQSCREEEACIYCIFLTWSASASEFGSS
jgi:hypothetical protein